MTPPRRETHVDRFRIAVWTPQTDAAGIDKFDEIVQNDPELLSLLQQLDAIPWAERQKRSNEVRKLSNAIERIKDAAGRQAFGRVQR